LNVFPSKSKSEIADKKVIHHQSGRWSARCLQEESGDSSTDGQDREALDGTGTGEGWWGGWDWDGSVLGWVRNTSSRRNVWETSSWDDTSDWLVGHGGIWTLRTRTDRSANRLANGRNRVDESGVGVNGDRETVARAGNWGRRRTVRATRATRSHNRRSDNRTSDNRRKRSASRSHDRRRGRRRVGVDSLQGA